MVGHDLPGLAAGTRQRSVPPRYSLMSLAIAETRRAFVSIFALIPEHEAIVLDRRAAARCRDHDRVEASPSISAIQASIFARA